MWTPFAWIHLIRETELRDLALKSDEELLFETGGKMPFGLRPRYATIAVTDQRLICVPVRAPTNVPFEPVDIWFPEIKAVGIGFDWLRFSQYFWIEKTDGGRVRIGLWYLRPLTNALLKAVEAFDGRRLEIMRDG